MNDFKKENKSMIDWMDETEKLVNSLSVNMDSKKATRVQDKINVSNQCHLHVCFQFISSCKRIFNKKYVFPRRHKIHQLV